MAADGPVTSTTEEMTDDEVRLFHRFGFRAAYWRPTEDDLRRLYAEATVVIEAT
jgi:hypothetical protein